MKRKYLAIGGFLMAIVFFCIAATFQNRFTTTADGSLVNGNVLTNLLASNIANNESIIPSGAAYDDGNGPVSDQTGDPVYAVSVTIGETYSYTGGPNEDGTFIAFYTNGTSLVFINIGSEEGSTLQFVASTNKVYLQGITPLTPVTGKFTPITNNWYGNFFGYFNLTSLPSGLTINQPTLTGFITDTGIEAVNPSQLAYTSTSTMSGTQGTQLLTFTSGTITNVGRGMSVIFNGNDQYNISDVSGTNVWITTTLQHSYTNLHPVVNPQEKIYYDTTGTFIGGAVNSGGGIHLTGFGQGNGLFMTDQNTGKTNGYLFSFSTVEGGPAMAMFSFNGAIPSYNISLKAPANWMIVGSNSLTFNVQEINTVAITTPTINATQGNFNNLTITNGAQSNYVWASTGTNGVGAWTGNLGGVSGGTLNNVISLQGQFATGQVGLLNVTNGIIGGVVMTLNTNNTVGFNSLGKNETIYNTSASTLTTLTIALPSNTVTQGVGEIVRYVTAGIVTTVTITGTVDIGAAVTTLAANSSIAYQQNATAGHWIRIQ